MRHMRNTLGRRVDSQLVAFPLRDADADFELRVVEMNRGVMILENVIRLAEALLDIAVPVGFRLRARPYCWATDCRPAGSRPRPASALLPDPGQNGNTS